MPFSLEVRIPISPADHYYNRVHLIAQSFHALGPAYANTRIRVTVGSDCEPEDLYSLLPWSKALNVEWHWVGLDDFALWHGTQHPFMATMMERFRPPFNSDYVLMIDADVVAMRPFDELIGQVANEPAVAAMMAHATPFGGDLVSHHVDMWQRMFRQHGLDEPRFEYEHSGWGLMDLKPERRFSPPYFNTGVVLAPSFLLEKLYPPYMTAMTSVRAVQDTYFIEQIALTLALCQTGIPFHVLPVRYNFPNQAEFDIARSSELDEMRFLHFLRTDVVHREHDFRNNQTISSLVGRRNLTGSNEALRQRVAALMPAMIAATSIVQSEALLEQSRSRLSE